MQGLADGYFVIPYTIGDYLADEIKTGKISTDLPEFEQAEKDVKDKINLILNNTGTLSPDYFHKKLGKIMWDECGMARNEVGLKKAIDEIKTLRKDFWANIKVMGSADTLNPELEKALRVADFIELGELMCVDALNRNESCGGHFREEYQEMEGDQKGEALRDDVNYKFVAAWEFKGVDNDPMLHKEELDYQVIKIAQRNYK
jgi:succinate dehydrogenase / fumarate reductase flavoprotein subunit